MDMKVMIHKIHSSFTLPSVNGTRTRRDAPKCDIAGTRYGVWTNFSGFVDYSCLPYPDLHDLRNCQTCHEESDANTPQASNWRSTINSTTCGACHDNVNFATGANHATGIAATDDTCATCHGPNTTFGLRPEDVHRVPSLEAAAKFKFEVVSITNTAPGEFPVVTVRVVDPTNNNTPYDLSVPNGPFGNALTGQTPSLTVRLGYRTTDITNQGAAAASLATTQQGQPINVAIVSGGVLQPGTTRNADLSFTRTFTTAMPAVASGSGIAEIEGRGVIDFNGDGTISSGSPNVRGSIEERIPIQSAGFPFRITDATVVPRRSVVDIQRCNDCHNPLDGFHGNSRTGNSEQCSVCHNSLMVYQDQQNRPDRPEGSLDLKYFTHALHAGVYQASNWGFDSGSEYPGRLNNCEGCHKPNTYYPVDSDQVLGSSFLRGALGGNVYTDDTAVTPNATVCGGCHIKDMVGLVNGTSTDPVAAHMVVNGASFSATRNADGTLIGPKETCAVCHGPGRSSDVKVKHRVGEFQYNP